MHSHLNIAPKPAQFILPGLLAALAVIATWVWHLRAVPHSYPDAPNGQFACLSYTLVGATQRMTPEQIQAQLRRDLEQLSTRTRCVRTYSVTNGLEYVPEIVRSLNMRLLMGLWIGRYPQENELELSAGIRLANEYRDVIDAVIVGNEVLLRHEQQPDTLAAMMRRVHEATKLPVTYADVWDFWVQNPSLQQAASFITIHILPYWEDDPIGIEHAIEHVDSIYRRVQQVFPGQRIYVGETGWPSEGRQREAAVPNLQNQARFTREFIAYATQHGFDYNFIEAYDQPWKRRLEGTVGGYWGLYDANGHEKFPLTGPVVADAQAWRGYVAGAVGAVVMLLVGWGLRVRAPLPLATLLLGGFALGALLLMQWQYAMLAVRTPAEGIALGIWALVANAAGVLALLLMLSTHAAGMAWLQRGQRWLHMALLIGTTYINMGLVFNARYRDFPMEFLALPAVTLLCLRWLQRESAAKPTGIEAAFCASWLVLSSVLIVILEHLTNSDALGWTALTLLLALASLPIETQQQQRAGQEANG